MNNRRKITLVVSSLKCGGAERVAVMLAQGFIDRGHQVSVVTLAAKETDFYQLPKEAERVALGVMKASPTPLHAVRNNLQRFLALRRAIQVINPDLVISFVARENILTLVSLGQTNYPVIVTEHNNQRFRSCGQPWSQIRRLVYPWAAQVVSVSEGVNSYFNWLPQTKKSVIYNPFVTPQNTEELLNLPPGVNPEKQWITAMGRLIEQKGFDILLTAFAKIAYRYPSWQLLILGEGELREKLAKLQKHLGLNNRVIFTGVINNPFSLLSRSQFFVMSSRFEGFPMAHGEALACGLPVIATDCPSGPQEIIRDGIDGILVPNEDVDALAEAMEKLMTNEEMRTDLAARATEVTQRFSLEKVMQDWEQLFATILG